MAGSRVAVTAVLVLYGLLGLALIAFLAPSTFIGADLAVYQRAGRDLLEQGNPYASAAELPYVFQYRYPPLLAMLIPVLGWPPLWYALLALATLATFLIGVRAGGPAYLLPVIVLGGAWGQPLLNGNVQPVLMLLLALVPLYRRAGAVALAVATMLKLHPVLGVAWYIGRRDWAALGWYAAALVGLALIQAPWLPQFVDFYLNQELASPFGQQGFGLRAIHPVLWLGGALLVGVAAYRWADSRYGWLLAVCLQLAALPRVLLVNLALVLSAPIPLRTRPQDR
ncbi:MAG TPA: glycosyltransferase 87 family protein [candidate division Zixibacteria bacterium]|nr:glycosyltransferase 87 family protein [candidate division Zixibacteria bacterium]